MFFSLTYICCSFRGGILSVVFPTVAICFWPAGNLECPRLFSDLILFPFLLLFFYIVPYPSFSSMSFSLIYICCSFRGGILPVVFPAVAICFWPAGNLECPCLFSDLILFPFVLLFFYIVPGEGKRIRSEKRQGHSRFPAGQKHMATVRKTTDRMPPRKLQQI